MYEPVKGGRVETIYGIDCYIPKPPPKEEIAHYHLPKAEQKWRRNELPIFSPRDIDIWTGTYYDPKEELDWNMARREELAKQTGEDQWDLDRYGKPKRIESIRPDVKYVSVPLANFRDKEMDRCDPWSGGYWMFINGKAVWLTPFHYFYLNWWEINVGYPQYRDTDRRKFYLWQWVFENPVCLGFCETAKRGEGKTYRALAILYLRTIYGRNILSGIQSKTDDDAEDMFQLKLVECYKNLPDFFIPINDNPTDPKTQLRFFSPSKKGKASLFNRLQQRKAIRSTINFKNAQPLAYDGQTVNGVFLRDEEGKTKKAICDVWERHGVTKDCVFRDGKVFGKIYSTTTVDKMDRGGAEFKIMWDSSNQHKVPEDENPGDTVSRMIRLFMPAYETEYFDEFGMSDTYKARARQTKERKKLVNNPGALLREILQYPWTERELFMSSGDTCQYDLNILRIREAIVLDPDFNGIRIGDFHWRDGIFGGEAYWKDNPDNGKWNVAFLFDEPRDSNKVKKERSMLDTFIYSPDNEDKFAGGFDPTKTSKQVDKRRSAAGGVIFMKEDIWYPEISGTWIADYLSFPIDPEEGWLDFIIGLFYYGAPFLPENNLGIPKKLKEIGCDNFVMNRPSNTFTNMNGSQDIPGMPAGEGTNDLMIKTKQTHIVKHGLKMILPRIIRNSIEFDPQFRTKYDLEVGGQLALTASQRPTPPPALDITASDMYQLWDNSGTQGKMVNLN